LKKEPNTIIKSSVLADGNYSPNGTLYITLAHARIRTSISNFIKVSSVIQMLLNSLRASTIRLSQQAIALAMSLKS
jgi:hypothetical protein